MIVSWNDGSQHDKYVFYKEFSLNDVERGLLISADVKQIIGKLNKTYL